MKKLSLMLLAIGFGVGLLVVSLLAETKSARVLAAEEASALASAQTVDYYLPYPGMLPDHPLYWVKMVRDKLLLVITRNPVDKYERLLLYADKRINAAKFLAEGNQLDLAVTTATKAENYLEQAAKQVPEEGKDDLRKAYLKHLEVLEEIRQKVSGAGKVTIEQVIQLTNEGLKNIVK